MVIDFNIFVYQGEWDFYGMLLFYIFFIVYLKFDLVIGEVYGFGVVQGLVMMFNVFCMELDGKFMQLYVVLMGGYFMIYDMLLSEKYFVFIILFVCFDFVEFFVGQGLFVDVLCYFESELIKIFVLCCDGMGELIVVEQFVNMVFYNGNVWEKDGKFYFDMIFLLYGDVFDFLYFFVKDKLVLLEVD